VRDYRDTVIEELAASEAALIERVVVLEADRQAYRALAQAAIHSLHALTGERDRGRATQHRLLHEYRELREQTVHRTVPA
jgi:hypothetical protein